MTQSHTGRNGLIEESTQTKKQRAAFNSTMDPSGQNTALLRSVFSGSPVHMTSANRKAFFTAGGNDRAGYFVSGDSPYENFKAFRSREVEGGFGFEDASVSMSYESSLSINSNGIASPQTDKADLYDANNADGLLGHANLSVNGFTTLEHEKDTSTQVTRNNDLPGRNVDASSDRLDNIGQYFNGAGNRTPTP